MTTLSPTMAVLILIFVTFLWGSWFQVVKHTGDYPIYVFLNWMFLFSIFVVWISIFLFEKQMVPDGVFMRSVPIREGHWQYFSADVFMQWECRSSSQR